MLSICEASANLDWPRVSREQVEGSSGLPFIIFPNSSIAIYYVIIYLSSFIDCHLSSHLSLIYHMWIAIYHLIYISSLPLKSHLSFIIYHLWGWCYWWICRKALESPTKPSPSSPGATGIDSASLLNQNSKSHKFSSKVKFELQTILFQFFTFHIPLHCIDGFN